MAGEKRHLYVRLKCPFCGWRTTAPESLGNHLVDKHSEKVIRGHVNIKKTLSRKKKPKKT